MIRLITFLTLFVFVFGCKSNSSNNIASKKDSSIIPIPSPEKLTRQEIDAYHNKLDEIFNKKLIKPNFNGAILVAKGGNILYEKYVGFINPRTKNNPISDSTSFHLASTSKPFTGVAVLKLIQEGKIKLNDKATLFFPQLPYPDVTIKDLLSHRSGLPNYLNFMEDRTKWPANKMIRNQDVLNFMTKYKPALSYRTGTRFNYCNTNFVMLALIIEKVSGQSYPQFLKKNIFEPLGMHHTFVYTPADSGKVIMSYKPSGALWVNDMFDDTYGDKNIYSTPRDLLKWDLGLYSNQFIRQSLLDSAYHPLSNESASTHNYGLGWRMLNLSNGKKVIYHNGKWHGFTPAFTRLLDEKAVIIILGNQYNSGIYQAAKYAYNVFGAYLQNQLGEDDEEVSTTVIPVPSPKTTAIQKNNAVAANRNVAATSSKKKVTVAVKQVSGKKKASEKQPVRSKSTAKKSSAKKTAAASKTTDTKKTKQSTSSKAASKTNTSKKKGQKSSSK